MILKCLGSGSSGNCYLLTDSNGKTLILDCGLSIREIKKGLNYDLRCVAGCIVTHQHKDHSKSAKELEEIGIEVYKPYEKCYKAMNFKKAPFLISTVPMQDKDGKFCHTNTDGSECPCYGFIISHPEMGNLLYVTDTEFVKWRFRNLNHILVSCNYQKKYLSKVAGKREHVFRGHMELETVKDFVTANNSSTLQNVILCHMSKESADHKECMQEVKSVLKSANVDVAEPNKEWILKKGDECPF